MEIKKLYMAFDAGSVGGVAEGTSIKVGGKEIDDILSIIDKDIADIMESLAVTVQVTSYQEGAHDAVQGAVNAVLGTLRNMRPDLVAASNKVKEIRTAYTQSATTLEQKLAAIVAELNKPSE